MFYKSRERLALAAGLLGTFFIVMCSTRDASAQQHGSRAAPAAPAPAMAPRDAPLQLQREQRKAEEVAWTSELPTVEQVRSTLQGKDKRDTVALQDAAFEVLRMYVCARGDIGMLQSKPGVSIHRDRYRAAQALRRIEDPMESPLSPEAQAYYGQGLGFHIQVLSRFVDRQDIDLYRASKLYRALGTQYAENKQASESQAVAHADPAQPQRDVASDRQTGTDMVVLGIQLGRALTLQPCNQGGPAPCSLGSRDPSGAALLQGLKQMLQPPQRPTASPTTTTFVGLSESQRPSWMGQASLGIVQAGATVVGVVINGLNTANTQTVIDVVERKYKEKTYSSEKFTCSNSEGARKDWARHIWSMDGLRVVYDPSGTGTCPAHGDKGTATLTFETDALRQLSSQAREQRLAAEPQL